MIPKNRIVAYSLLAHINDHDVGIRDLAEIFVPLVKRALSNLYQSGITCGLFKDLKARIDELYHFDIPFPVLTNILKRIEAEVNSGSLKVLVVNRDNSFTMSKFAFIEFEETVRQQEAAIANIDALYQGYLEENGLDQGDQMSLYAFLDQNRAEMSGYFTRREEFESSIDFTAQAKFVNSIRNNLEAFNTLRQIYMGSLITCYLEMDIEEIRAANVELVLDTNFLVSLLGLSSEESEHTCCKVVEIGKKLGYKCTILSITVDETYALLNRVAQTLGSSFFTSAMSSESIESACERRNLKKTDLQKIASSLVPYLEKNLKIQIVPVTKELKESAEKSDIYTWTIDRKNNPAGAPHDGIAYYYVQKKRGKLIRDFKDANCWFIADSQYSGTPHGKEHGTIGERIQATYLINILWLTKPSVLTKDIGTIGLTKVVASTMQKSLPDPHVLHELDENIRKYALEDISKKDLVAVAHSSACKTVENFRKLTAAARKSPDELVQELRELAKQARKETADREEKAKCKIGEMEKKVKEKDSEIQRALDTGRKREEGRLDAEILRLDTAIKSLSQIKGSLETKAKGSVNWRLAVVIGILILSPISCFIAALRLGWNKMEGFIAFLLFLPTVILLIYFGVTKKLFAPGEAYKNALQKTVDNYFKKYGFDIDQFNKLLSDKTSLIKLREGSSTKGDAEQKHGQVLH